MVSLIKIEYRSQIILKDIGSNEISFSSGYDSGWVGVMFERRQLSQNNCQLSVFLDENLLYKGTFGCNYSLYTVSSLNMVTSVYAGDENYSQYFGNFGTFRFVLL